ncbi:MAG: hypothetical protein WAO69_06110, partial [Aestuariivita sp.]|uniref:hypothetical protein n=1 Tax=Aestuariivita sp. TaxID=1872407 RepID=UPI003BB0EFA3
TSEELIGTYWDATQRCAYIVLDHTRYFTDRKIQSIDIKSAEDRAKAVIQDYLNTEGCIAQTVLLSFEMPKTSLVPVDRTSFLDIADVVSKRRGLSLAAVAALVGAVGATSVAAEPAVSQINSKLSFQSTAHSNNVGTDIGAGVLAGSVTFPVGVRYGFQIDGALGKDGGDELAGLGGHLFWRDPSVAMVGLIFGTVDINRDGAALDQRTDRIGLELEYYVEDFTVYAMAGRQSGRNILEGDRHSGIGLVCNRRSVSEHGFRQNP